MPRRQHSIFNRIRPYHIVAQANAGRIIFADNEDRSRFILQMYATNIGKPGTNLYRKDVEDLSQAILKEGRIPIGVVEKEHAPLVDIFSFALGKDEYHLGLVPRSTNGLSRYMQKLNIGYAKYYNAKYVRKGTLFQNRFKGELVHTPEQLAELISYINVRKILDLKDPQWQKRGVKSTQSLLEFFQEYPFSSFQDLFAGRNSCLVSEQSRKHLRGVLGKDFFIRGTYLKAVNDYLQGHEKHAFI